MTNQYTTTVRRYYEQTWSEAPTEEQIEATAEEIEARVLELEQELEHREPAEQEFIARVSQLNHQRMRAREIVLAEFLPTDETV